MKTGRYSTPELLESRIAPAGLITATLDQGALNLTGGIDATSVIIQEVASKTWALTGYAGTLISFNGAAATAQVFISGIKGDVSLNFGPNADSIGFDRVKIPKNLTADLGDGANGISLVESNIGGRFTYTGGSGSDSVGVYGEKVTIGGNVIATMGNGSNGFFMGADVGSIAGDLNITGGTGPDFLQLTRGSIKIKGNLFFDAGTFGSTTILIEARSVEVGRDLTLFDSDTGSVVNVNPTVSLKVGGRLTVDGRGGADTINIGVGTVRVHLGALTVITAADADNDIVNVTPSGFLTVKGDLDLTSNGGGILNTISADVIRVGRDINVLDGPAGAATVKDIIRGTSELSVGRNLVMSSDADFGSHNVQAGRLKIGRDLYSSSNDGVFTALFVSQGDIKGSLFSISNDSAGLELDGTALRIKGDLVVASPVSASLDAQLVSLSVGRDLRMTSTSGIADLYIDLARTLTVGRDIALSHQGTTFKAVITVASARLGGFFQIDATTTGAITQTFIGELGKIQIGGALSLVTAAAGPSDTTLTNLSVGGATSFTSGAGSDKLRINDSIFAGVVNFGMGGGADSVLIEQIDTVTRGGTLFKGDVSINLDSGADSLVIGLTADAHRVAFKKTATFDGGLDVDTYTVAAAPAVTFPTGQPSVTGF